MASAYMSNLVGRVLDASHGRTCEEDEQCDAFCVCGKEHIRYLYTIHNELTGRTIYPIGFSCVKKFHRNNMDEETTVMEGMFRLYRAIRNQERIELSSKYFSKKLLFALYEDGAFAPSRFNNYDGYNDYALLLDMFNKRNKSDITDR